MRFAYADPPYVGQARKLYKEPETDHRALVGRLLRDYPDGWALSLSTPSIYYVTGLLEEAGCFGMEGGYRVAAWVKPFAIFKPGVNPAYAWEPVIFKGGRKRDRRAATVRDWTSCNITLKKGLCGAKPEGFSLWLFSLLGMEADDEFHDLFPGTGGVTAAWEKYRETLRVG